MIKNICWTQFWRFFGCGFSSGIPYFWIAMTLPMYGADQYMATHFSWISFLFLPYTLKPLWAVGLDYATHRYQAQKALWLKTILLISQACIVYALLCIAGHINDSNITCVWFWTIVLGFFGSIQDIIMEGYRIQASDRQETMGNYIFGTQTGFRVAGLVMSSGALCIAHYWSWTYAMYALMGCMGAIFVTTGLSVNLNTAPKPVRASALSYGVQLRTTLEEMFTWGSLPVSFFLHLFSYKIIDGFIRWMWPVFLVNQGYSKLELMYADKGLGWASVLLGGIIAQKALTVYTVRKALGGWAILQTAAYVIMPLQWYVGKHLGILFISSCMHQTLSGAGNLLVWVYISRYCYGDDAMMKYSIVSSVFSLERICVAWCSSVLYQHVDPCVFFIFGILFSCIASVAFTCEIGFPHRSGKQ
jgi:PAT family beta-lactamase induction signal transducer AmpG